MKIGGKSETGGNASWSQGGGRPCNKQYDCPYLADSEDPTENENDVSVSFDTVDHEILTIVYQFLLTFRV